MTHRYGPNSFKVHRLPIPRAGQVLGLVGKNGIGKSTALKVLAGKLKPNLGNFSDAPDWQQILLHFRGSELQNYFTKILEDNLKVCPSICFGWPLGCFWLSVFGGVALIVLEAQRGLG